MMAVRREWMLRITRTTRSEGVTLVLEGRLAGPWVDELARCWKGLAATQSAGPTCVQLDGVTFIDDAGKVLLRTMHEEGATLAASGCMTREILDEIRRQ
jgi:ABC-type transporter Mla MlaB component